MSDDPTLAQSTVDALSNIATINNSILIKKGNVLLSMSAGRDIVARIALDEEFPETIPVYDGLGDLLKLIKLFDDPKVKYCGKHLIMRSGRNSQKFRYAKEQLFGTDNKASIRIPKSDPLDMELNYKFEFELTNDSMTKIKRAAQITGSPDFVVRKSELGTLEVVCTNKSNPETANEYAVDTGVQTDMDGVVAFSIANLKMAAGDYKVAVSSERNLSHWHRIQNGDPVDYQYWVAVSIVDDKR